MSLLGIRWKVDAEVSGFEYQFVDYIIKGYSGQDIMKVEAVIKLDVDTVQDRHPATKRSLFSQIIQVDIPHNN